MEEAEFRRGIRDRLEPAWERLEQFYGPTLRRQASLILARDMDPDDAVGDVWVSALKAARSYDPARSPFPWLARICTNTCLNRRRKKLRFLSVFPETEPAAPDGASGDERTAARGALRTALQAIPTREREAVTLRFLFEVSVAEIAELLDVRPNSVNQTLIRGLTHLRTCALAPELETWMTELEKR